MVFGREGQYPQNNNNTRDRGKGIKLYNIVFG